MNPLAWCAHHRLLGWWCCYPAEPVVQRMICQSAAKSITFTVFTSEAPQCRHQHGEAQLADGRASTQAAGWPQLRSVRCCSDVGWQCVAVCVYVVDRRPCRAQRPLSGAAPSQQETTLFGSYIFGYRLPGVACPLTLLLAALLRACACACAPLPGVDMAGKSVLMVRWRACILAACILCPRQPAQQVSGMGACRH